MFYIKSALKYIIKNFGYLFLFTLIPAIGLTFTADKSAYFNFMNDIIHYKSYNFFQVYSDFSLIVTKFTLLRILVLIAIVFITAILLSIIEKHLRIGRLNFRNNFSRINENIISVLLIGAVLVIIVEAWAALLSAILMFLNMLFSGITLYFICYFFILSGYAGLFAIIPYLALWICCRNITGYSFYDAFMYSINLLSGKLKRIYFAFVLPILIFVSVILITDNFADKLTVVFVYIQNQLYYMYYLVLAFIVYFDLDKLERKDNVNIFLK